MPRSKQLARVLVPRRLRNWLRAPQKSLLWGLGEARYLLGARTLTDIRPGWSVVCHPLAWPHSYFAQQDDPEQVTEFDSFIARCVPGMVLFDLGAHFGLFSLAALHYGGPSARAIAVDASPTAVRMIRIQAQLNHVSDRLQVLHACVSDRPGVRDMVAVGVLADGYYTAPAADHTATETTRTPATTLDDLVSRFGLPPTHVKMDIEGYEGLALRGAQTLLSGPRPPVLFLELHNELIRDRGEDPGEVLDDLDRLRYVAASPSGGRLTRTDLLSAPLVRAVLTRA